MFLCSSISHSLVFMSLGDPLVRPGFPRRLADRLPVVPCGRAEVSSNAANTGPASAPPRGASEPNPCPRSATACSPTEPHLEPVHCPSSRARDEGTRDEGWRDMSSFTLFVFSKPSIDSLLQSLQCAFASIALNGRGITRRGRHTCTQAVVLCPLSSFQPVSSADLHASRRKRNASMSLRFQLFKGEKGKQNGSSTASHRASAALTRSNLPAHRPRLSRREAQLIISERPCCVPHPQAPHSPKLSQETKTLLPDVSHTAVIHAR
ncbi:hypothetical protein LZ31DRAFT_240255 [Colletotrichum somersetense]|nr:hypothetical protein LZ31DRAFT_240255 [Colletotrichum somersetense]